MQVVRTGEVKVEEQPESKKPDELKTRVDEWARKVIEVTPEELKKLETTVDEWLTF